MSPNDTPAVNVRKAVSRRVRFEVLRRDNHTCRYCGASAPNVALTVDHVVPSALGGSDDPSNLVTACRDCNAGKGSTSPDERVVAEVDELAVKYAAAFEQASEMRRAKAATEREVAEDFYVEAHKMWPHDDWLPGDWDTSIIRLAGAGLELEAMLAYVSVAVCAMNIPPRRMFRYFCGCCWNEVSRRQELAMELLRGDGQP
jgi:hypothetical protein